eukprot:scaffold64853_cov65-Phaeocystis_antarctica.AAC.3
MLNASVQPRSRHTRARSGCCYHTVWVEGGAVAMYGLCLRCLCVSSSPRYLFVGVRICFHTLLNVAVAGGPRPANGPPPALQAGELGAAQNPEFSHRNRDPRTHRREHETIRLP